MDTFESNSSELEYKLCDSYIGNVELKYKDKEVGEGAQICNDPKINEWHDTDKRYLHGSMHISLTHFYKVELVRTSHVSFHLFFL